MTGISNEVIHQPINPRRLRMKHKIMQIRWNRFRTFCFISFHPILHTSPHLPSFQKSPLHILMYIVSAGIKSMVRWNLDDLSGYSSSNLSYLLYLFYPVNTGP